MILTENLSKSFGDKAAVDELNLKIEKGTFFCFLGPNGAGKTTTIKMLTGLLKPSVGRALIGGYDIQKEPLNAKRVIGYVPDQPFLYDKLTGREFLRFVAGLFQLSSDEFIEKSEYLLDLFNLTDVADQLIEDYSHGMRQKLSFTGCFIHDPKIIVVDEPWVGLDPKNIRFIKDFLKDKTRRDGLTVFMSTHSLGIAEEIADTIAIINNGKLLHRGSVTEIKELHKLSGSFEDVFLALTSESPGEGE